MQVNGTRCTAACHTAASPECDCVCQGRYHGCANGLAPQSAQTVARTMMRNDVRSGWWRDKLKTSVPSWQDKLQAGLGCGPSANGSWSPQQAWLPGRSGAPVPVIVPTIDMPANPETVEPPAPVVIALVCRECPWLLPYSKADEYEEERAEHLKTGHAVYEWTDAGGVQ